MALFFSVDDLPDRAVSCPRYILCTLSNQASSRELESQACQGPDLLAA